MKAVIFGANGFIGSYLFDLLTKKNWDIRGTFFPTSNNRDPRLSYYNIGEQDPPAELLSSQTHYFFCTNFGSIDYCKKNPAETAKINIGGVTNLLKKIKNLQSIPIYLSSNAVFSGVKADYDESDTPDPVTEYGGQKLAVENFIRNNFSKYIILRLTKVYGNNPFDNSLFSNWLQTWKTQKEISVVSDQLLSPIFLPDIGTLLLRLILAQQYGIFHLSGPITKSPYEFSIDFAKYLKIDQKMIKKIKTSDLGLVEQRPLYNSLCTDKISRLFPEINFTTPETVFKFYK